MLQKEVKKEVCPKDLLYCFSKWRPAVQEIELKCKLSKANGEKLSFQTMSHAIRVRKGFGEISYYAKVTNDEVKGWEGSTLQGTM